MSWRAFDVDQLIGPDHSARAIWSLVGRLNLTPFETDIQSLEDHSGRPRWSPQLLISVWIYGYSLGISSARALERMMDYEPGLRWLCGAEVINHHTLSDFRLSQKDALQSLFVQVLALMDQEGLMDLSTIMHDGTKMRAVAGKGALRRKQTISERLVKAQELVKEMDEQEKQQQGEGEDKRRQAALERVARERLERMEAAMKELDVRQKEEPKKDPEQVRVSLSEPEARKMKHPDGGWAPSYNVQVSTEGKSRIVVAVGVTQAANDQKELEPAMKSIEANTGKKIDRLIVDNGYASRPNVEAAEAKKVQLIAPWKDDRSREAGAIAANGLDPKYAPSVFRLAGEADALVCPAEKLLLPLKTKKHHGVPKTIYAASAEDCEQCQGKAACCGPKATARQVEKAVESPAMQAYLERMKQPEIQELYKRRSEVAEFPHMWNKAIRGRKRFRVRGLVKVEKETIWMTLSYNIQQWMRLSTTLAA
jgi:transposase